jgi:peptidoglycan/LPS O-acetylase OafA/YrhL
VEAFFRSLVAGRAMGVYRYCLAVCVVLFHCHVLIFGFSIGVVAVISFYILSGFVMTELIRRHYPTPSDTLKFYVDRLARLAPQFWFYTTLTLVFLAVGFIAPRLATDVSASSVLLNYLIVPLNFYRFEPFGLERAILIPQAWSLGLEALFYAIVPVILHRCGVRLWFWIAAGSFGVFLAATFGVLSSIDFGYQQLPGTLFIFIIGMALADRSRQAHILVGCLFIACAVVFAIVCAPGSALFDQKFSKEVLLGILIGTLAVAALRDKASTPFDERAGNLSYGLFLNHSILIELAIAYYKIEQFNLEWVVGIVVCATVMSAVTFRWLEQPILVWRRHLRYGSISPIAANTRGILNAPTFASPTSGVT